MLAFWLACSTVILSLTKGNKNPDSEQVIVSIVFILHAGKNIPDLFYMSRSAVPEGTGLAETAGKEDPVEPFVSYAVSRGVVASRHWG